MTLPEVTVTGSAATDTGTVSATKTDTRIFDTPAAIQVVPKEVLEDQQVVQLKDALRNVSGVYPGIHYGTKAERFIIRGFEQSFIYRNGFRLPNFYGVRETSNLERVEVLKGPAAMLYGRIEPGGLINVVTKTPRAAPHYALEQEAGSFDFLRTIFSATGPLFRNEALAYTPSWNLIATYALTDTEILADNSSAKDNELPNVPEHGGSLWTRYQFQAGDLRGLTLGAGVFLQGERFIDRTNTAIMPGYGRVDVLAAYEWKVGPSKLTVQLNVLNLLDKEYAESSPSGPGPFNYTPGAPRTFIGSLGIEF